MKKLSKLLLLLTFVQSCTATTNTENQDFLWLEELKTTRAVEWVKKQNTKTIKVLGSNPRFKSTRKNILARLNKKEKLQMIFYVGDEIAKITKNLDNSMGVLESIWFEESAKNIQNGENLLISIF